MGTYVHYGCCPCAPDGWLNFDASPTLRIQKIPLIGKKIAPVIFPDAARCGDIIKGLPVPDGTADAAYCSHTLEHLSLEDCRIALRNTFRMLRPGGVFRLVVPDLKLMAQEYVASTDPAAAHELNNAMMLRPQKRPRGIGALVRLWLGNSEHLWMYDYGSMSTELTTAGFVNVRPAVMGDSGDKMFDLVEDRDRWNRAVAVHCNRPA